MGLHEISGYPDYKVADDLRVYSCKSHKYLSANNKRGNVSLYKNSVRKVFSRDMLYNILHPVDTSGFYPVPGFDEYFASRDGRVYSNKWKRVLKPSLDSYGYEVVSVFNGGKETMKNVKVHRLVAMTFIPNPHGFETIDHLNNIKIDNRVENLEWVTISENLHRQWARRKCLTGGNKCEKFCSVNKFCDAYGGK